MATWNVKRLGEGDKRLDLLAGVVQEVDLLALQEVMTRDAVRDLLALLPGWDAVISPRAVGRRRYREFYAVLYRATAATVTRSFLVEDPSDELVREPFVVCFESGQFDFCLLDFHATYTGGTKVRDRELEAVGRLAEGLREASAEKDWIVVGDFNRPDTAHGFDALHNAGWRCVLEATSPPTTIGRRGYRNGYDHILIDSRVTREWAGAANRYPLVDTTCPGNPSWCAERIADHAPVVAVFPVGGADDD